LSIERLETLLEEKKKDTPCVRKQEIEEMFDAIAPRYDFLNRLLSLGLDRRWRKKAVDCLNVPENGRVLDMACGTADVALEIASRYPSAADISGVDISREMLKIGRKKVEAAGEEKRIRLIEGACEEIPVSDGIFDGAIIAFGIRNVADRPAGLREFRRVLKPGAKLVILEFSNPRSPLFRWIFHIYFHRVLPWIGGIFSRRSAYLYLPRSVDVFPEPDQFVGLISDAGFDDIRYQPLSCGIVTLYEARSLSD
jgi:demethylmenaquinone methyltransferase/2-methoxy-6-polyprenyl-1,4-benzoquinol methylase